MTKKPTIVDIAKLLGVSTATVHRALHDHPNMTPMTKSRVLNAAQKLGYKPNLAARYLSSKRSVKISVNTLKGTTSFWDEVRNGVEDEKKNLDLENVQIEYRTYPQLGEGEAAAFEAALDQNADGIICFPSDTEQLKPLMRRAARSNTPIVFVATDAPGSGRLAVVSVDTMASGALAADFIGRLVGGHGRIGVTVFDSKIYEHAEKYRGFESTLRTYYPGIRVHTPIEDHDRYEVSYEETRKLLTDNPDMVGMYITTEASMPVIKAARDLGRLDKLTIVATDLFPELAEEIRNGAVSATIYQRPRTQGRMAFRVLHQYLMEGEFPPSHVTYAPHFVMRGNLDFFLKRVAVESQPARARGGSGLKARAIAK